MLMKNASLTFINGSENYKPSTLKEHEKSAMHKRAGEVTEHEKAEEQGTSVKRRIVQEVPEDAPINRGLKVMRSEEQKIVSKLHDVAYYVAKRNLPFTEFEHLLNLEKLHGVEYKLKSYQNTTGCRSFIQNIAVYLFRIDISEKVERVNFITVLCDGSTDTSITEQEVIYVIFADPDSFRPILAFFEVAALTESQDAVGLKQAIQLSFKSNKLSHVLDKIVFLSSDGASVNSGQSSGLISLLKEDYEWVVFVWCFSHRLELALQDSLKDFMAPVDESLRHLFYLYQKSSKKVRELKKLYELLCPMYEMYGASIKPTKATGTRWIDHKLRAMRQVVNKYGLYVSHLINVVADTSKKCDRALLKGKLEKLMDAKVLLRCALFIDILGPARAFSLITQQEGAFIVDIVDSVSTTLSNYQRMMTKFELDPNAIFELPTLKSVITAIEEDDMEDGIPRYQGQKVKYYIREKSFLRNNIGSILRNIHECYSSRFRGVTSEANSAVDASKEGDNIIFDICRVLNTSVWPSMAQVSQSDDESVLSIQVKALRSIYLHYKNMDVFSGISEEVVIDGLIDLVRYSQRYFDTSVADPLDLLSKVYNLGKNKPQWKDVLRVLEICLCAPFSNATLERFFNHLKMLKTPTRSRLNTSSLNSSLRIRVTGPTLAEFNARHNEKCVNQWYRASGRRPGQMKRKAYKKRETGKKARTEFRVEEFLA